MDKLLVHGNGSLRGSINISGSKNASLPILAATLLTDDASIVRRVPDVSDTNYMLQILRALGAEVERSSGTVRVELETGVKIPTGECKNEDGMVAVGEGQWE